MIWEGVITILGMLGFGIILEDGQDLFLVNEDSYLAIVPTQSFELGTPLFVVMSEKTGIIDALRFRHQSEI